MFEGKRTPVTLFRSTDDGAPKLTNALGSLKTVLKACLITGYGGKAGLGWEMLFEETNSAVFRSKALDSNRFYLKVDNNTMERAATVSAYRQMMSLDAGKGEFFNTNQNFGYIQYDQYEQPWFLVGCGKAFILCVQKTDLSSSTMMYFGDFASVLPGDTGNTLMCNSTYHGNGAEYLVTGSLSNIGYAEDGIASHVAKSYVGGESSAYAVLGGAAYHGYVSSTTYPDKISGGLSASPVLLFEKTASYQEYCLRGAVSGLFKSMNNLLDFKDGENIGKLDGSDDEYIKVNLSDARDGDEYYLINASAWEL